MDRPDPPPTNPFYSRKPNQPLDYGPRPSSSADLDRSERLQYLDGQSGIYRLAFAAMPLPGLAEPVVLGGVHIFQQDGPIWAQSTYIIQRPGWRTVYDKLMHQSYLEVGEGLHLTLCWLPVQVPVDRHISSAFSQWRDEVLAAVGVLAVVLDDRVAQAELLEDLIVLDSSTAEPLAAVDQAIRVRRFPPSKTVMPAQNTLLRSIGADALSEEKAHLVASRWYLKAAQAGPTPDAIVFLWIALEALVPATGNGKSSDVRGVERSLREAGADPTSWNPSIGRCAGLRAQIVHHGIERPPALHDGFYALEEAVRLLLRYRLNIGPGAWPLAVGETNVRAPFKRLARRLQSKVKISIRIAGVG